MVEYGRIIISISGTQLLENEVELIQNSLVLGIILFKENYESKAQLRKLIVDIQNTAHKDIPIFTDHEGGNIQWLLEGFTHLPPAKVYGIFYDIHPEVGTILARYFGKILAQELSEFGIIPLAPVLDLDLGNQAISNKDRAFHKDPRACIELTKAFILGMHICQIPATGKHFPDLSLNIGDPHYTTLVDDRPLENITGIQVYKSLIPHLKAIMPTHTLYPKVDAKNIVALSQTWLSMLRSTLKFTGVVLSDCLSMKGTGTKTLSEKASSFLSHIDVIILCHQLPKQYLELFKQLTAHATTAEQNKRITLWVDSTANARLALKSTVTPRKSIPAPACP